jgi:phosphopantetheinyl transferase (holo-ACP synthase)
MTRKFIPVEEAAKEWFKNPEFSAAYNALEEEFALAEALIKARAQAEMTQEQVADLSVLETGHPDLKRQ